MLPSGPEEEETTRGEKDKLHPEIEKAASIEMDSDTIYHINTHSSSHSFGVVPVQRSSRTAFGPRSSTSDDISRMMCHFLVGNIKTNHNAKKSQEMSRLCVR
jgi:hypothetical protein